jgi:hypothetical protein
MFMKNPFRVVSLEPEAPALIADLVDDLIAQRDATVAQLSRFGRFGRAVSEANEKRDRAKEALRAFLGAETAALRQWAESGGDEPPARDQERHGALVAAVEAAEREIEAAEAAQRTIEPACNRILATLGAIAVRLDERRADAVAAEALREVDELVPLMADATARLARILAARDALQRHSFSFEREPARARVWLAAAGKLAGIPAAIQVRPTTVEIETQIAPWRAKIL